MYFFSYKIRNPSLILVSLFLISFNPTKSLWAQEVITAEKFFGQRAEMKWKKKRKMSDDKNPTKTAKLFI